MGQASAKPPPTQSISLTECRLSSYDSAVTLTLVCLGAPHPKPPLQDCSCQAPAPLALPEGRGGQGVATPPLQLSLHLPLV